MAWPELRDIAQWVKVLATTTDDLSSTPWDSSVGRERSDSHELSSDLHTCAQQHVYTQNNYMLRDKMERNKTCGRWGFE